MNKKQGSIGLKQKPREVGISDNIFYDNVRTERAYYMKVSEQKLGTNKSMLTFQMEDQLWLLRAEHYKREQNFNNEMSQN